MIALVFAAMLMVGDPVPVPRPRNAGEWITDADYPLAALRMDEQGTVAFALDVDRTGRMTGCTILTSSGSGALDAQTCRLILARGKFAPARDARGVAVDGRLVRRIRWELPAKAPTPLVAWAKVSRMRLSGDGAVEGCTVRNFGPVPDPDSFCTYAARTPRAVLLAMRGGAGPRAVDVIEETNFAVDGRRAHPIEGRQRGRRLIAATMSRSSVSAAGVASGCRIVEAFGDPLLQPRLCAKMFDGPFVPARDAAGSARAAEIAVTVATSVEQP